MGQIFRAFIPGLINGLIILPVASIFMGFYLSISLESKLAILNIALILIAIILILRHHFSRDRVRVVQTQGQPHTYLIENKVARHIPDPATFSYLGQVHGFDWKDIEVISDDAFRKQFSSGSILPSIRPHCEAFHEQKTKQNSQKEP